jgi:Cys-tRNA(Pro)/Cys-tRNA(Cys) deacylase
MTPAVDQLTDLGIVHQLLSYSHDPDAASYGEEAAEVLGIDPDTVFKTLLVSLTGARVVTGANANANANEAHDADRLVVCLVPVTGQLDLRELARAAGAKKATMADPKVAERTTGYVVGGISPFGQRKRLQTFVDETVEILELIRVSGGRRGLEIELDPQDLITVLSATTAALASA